jgi:hypothetical protein
MSDDDTLTQAALDDLAIIVIEAQRIAAGDGDAGGALATIDQAVYHLRLMVKPNPDACAKITHYNGLLAERYATARAELSRLAEYRR